MRHIDGHLFEALGLPCTRCGLAEGHYDDWPTQCGGQPGASRAPANTGSNFRPIRSMGSDGRAARSKPLGHVIETEAILFPDVDELLGRLRVSKR
jgi:hypothetical protein